MWMVTLDCVGGTTFDRLLRDRIVERLTPDCSLPGLVTDAPCIRAAALAPAVPDHTVLTGLAALWVLGVATLPDPVMVVARPGAHRIVPRGRTRTVTRTSARTLVRAATLSRTRVARIDDAAADALRWEDLGLAFAALAPLIASDASLAARINAAVAARHAGAPGQARMVDAWRTLVVAVGSSSAAGTHLPVAA